MLAIFDLDGNFIGTISKEYYVDKEPLGYFLLWSDYIIVENYNELNEIFTWHFLKSML